MFDEGTFVEAFDGNAGLDRFDLEVHHRNLVVGDTSSHNFDATWPGDHDTSCGGADTSRVVSAANDSESFYMCRDHVMTSMGDIDGYSVVSMSPKFTFPSIRRVCWDQNVTWSTMNTRQWTEVVVRPATELPPGRLSHVNLRFEGVDDSALFHGPTTVGVMLQGPSGAGAFYGRAERWYDDYYFNDAEGSASKAIRRQHCLTDNNDGTITLSIQQQSGVYSRSFAGSFPPDARVVLEDHDYTPNKLDGPGPQPTSSYTWHWDNIIVET